jgi:hypothetical protein
MRPARDTGPDGNRHNAQATFVAGMDVEGWLFERERSISRGEWQTLTRRVREEPRLLGEYAAAGVAPTTSAATAALYEKLLRLTILPTWSDRALRDITAAQISACRTGMRNTLTQQATPQPAPLAEERLR